MGRLGIMEHHQVLSCRAIYIYKNMRQIITFKMLRGLTYKTFMKIRVDTVKSYGRDAIVQKCPVRH